jgi:hypothetical protein
MSTRWISVKEDVDHILRRAVLRFGLDSGEAGIDHVWIIVQNADNSFLLLQSYIEEYSLGTFMNLSRKAGFNPMSAGERKKQFMKCL